MSHLDAHFTVRATCGLEVYPTPVVGGEHGLEPGFVYVVDTNDAIASFGIAPHPVREVRDRRIALKIIASDPPAGASIRISAPDGQAIEGNDGMIAEGEVTAGLQALGLYREWLCDPDGNWLMVGRELGDGDTTPLGQIVIQGVPVVVQGVPLVLTPPAARLPAITARSVRVVPRAAPPLALRAPAPRAATVELVDAFADNSLEMDAERDQFRVAATLQTDVVQALYERLPFTLRKTSTDTTVAEEIGMMRFDRSRIDPSCEVRLVADLEVSAAGQTATLQLYSLSDGVLRATLTTTARIATKCTAVLAGLPGAEVLYSVRLARTGGTAGQIVSCRSAAIEVDRG
jgi:hypothetical protein